MLTVRGTFDGKNIKPLDPVPFDGKTEVLITFLRRDARSTAKKTGTWRDLKGSARGENLTTALLTSRKKDLMREK